jgi:hypothetical protein
MDLHRGQQVEKQWRRKLYNNSGVNESSGRHNKAGGNRYTTQQFATPAEKATHTPRESMGKPQGMLTASHQHVLSYNKTFNAVGMVVFNQ